MPERYVCAEKRRAMDSLIVLGVHTGLHGANSHAGLVRSSYRGILAVFK